ncbi:MAG: hypothetical protein H8E41_04285 [Desulfobulbaceae bacterium]|uniref:Uncharacterized protein n=1 Tax=Candidatus Desulfobia pelagia TaxID=2841692 RepID=A0A8J6NBJ4_9BACT|nr:hypothetical protein [Candidatus Desulfobia pelagia]
MNEIEKIIDQMEPEDALKAIAEVADKLLSHTSDEARLDFVVSLIGDTGADKISSMVNL